MDGVILSGERRLARAVRGERVLRAAERRAIERDGLVTAGDVGYLDPDGYLFLCDRKKDMVISGGVNIYPAEIEAALLALSGVRDCAVFGIPNAEFGEAL